ncbi:unnamed protein product [Allacma fusca]|uniref:Uncharacterized protein n=1 Tax=Allacma fusca TaxID=39272 RepID=A0A8J2LD83_9HEXA|nr:unnamed protein product [Allacma fusca]
MRLFFLLKKYINCGSHIARRHCDNGYDVLSNCKMGRPSRWQITNCCLQVTIRFGFMIKIVDARECIQDI